MEEVRDVRRTGSALPSKERKLVAVVSSSSPYYLYGDVEEEYEGDDTPLPKSIVGGWVRHDHMDRVAPRCRKSEAKYFRQPIPPSEAPHRNTD